MRHLIIHIRYMELVTVAVFPTSFAANLVQGRLQADGIECYIKDEHSVHLNPYFNNALGGIKLQVKEEDVGLAVFTLRQLGYRTVFDQLPVSEKKPPHMAVRFAKFLAATAVVLGWLYFTEFGATLPW